MKTEFTVQGTVTGRWSGMHPNLSAPYSPGKSVNPGTFFQDFSDTGRRASSLPPTMAVPYGKIYELCGGSRQPGLKAKELWVVTSSHKGRKPRGCRHLTPAGVWRDFSWQRDSETGLMEWRRND